MTAHRKRHLDPRMLNPVVKGRHRTAAEWRHSEWCLENDDLRDLYVGGPYPQTFWERYGAVILVQVVLACLLVAWLVWGGRG